MVKKDNLDALFGELDGQWRGTPEHDNLTRDAHLGIAMHDAGKPFQDNIDPRIKALIENHQP